MKTEYFLNSRQRGLSLWLGGKTSMLST